MKTPRDVQACAPAYVHPEKIDDHIVFLAGDTGGSGWPWAALLLPVEIVGDRAWVVIEGAPAKSPYEKAKLFRASHWMRQLDQRPPYRLSVVQKDWPKTGQFVLVLFLYFQSKGIGDITEEFAQTPAHVALPPDYEDTVAEAINEYLACSSQAKLRSGLIRQAAGTVVDPAGAVTFALASCQYPSDIFDHMPGNTAATRGPADASLLALGDLLDKDSAPTLLLLVGDQVYVDATAGLFDPKILNDKYRIPYQNRGESRGAQAVMQGLDLERHLMLDDHEINDNWDLGEPTLPGQPSADTLGIKAYWANQRLDRPKRLDKLWRDDIVHRGLPFFLCDARAHRQGRTATNCAVQTIMDEEQFKALFHWLVTPAYEKFPKFVTTASAVLPRSLAVARDPACALHSDAWDGYPKSMHDLLAYVCDNEIKGLVFLSGDEHISNYVRATVTNLNSKSRCTFHSVHSSALYAPYPFANAVKEDFARSETFRFPHPTNGPYSCEVRAVFAPEGDGFAVLTALPSSAGWQLQVVFHDAQGPKHTERHLLDLSPPGA
jgi:hypothetical protein